MTAATLTPEWGYTRDRSWYRSRPNNTPTKVHCESVAESGMAACNTRIMLYMEHPWSVAQVRESTPTLLCRRCFS